MSSFNESNVDQYKTEHECDEHWELRRKFLLTHGDKFPIDELLCLAQVFTNVEFLGCRYPKETMRIIAELSKDVVQDYRERQKTRLQRTFVGASDAASSKAKGQSRQEISSNISTNTAGQTLRNNYQNFRKAEESSNQNNTSAPNLDTVPSCSKEPLYSNFQSSSNSFMKTQESSNQNNDSISNTNVVPSSSGLSSNNKYQPTSNSLKRTHESTPQDRYLASKKKKLNTKAAEVVLFEYMNDTPQSIVARVANCNNVDLKWKFDRIGFNVKCTVIFNNYEIGSAVGPNQKAAKKEASAIVLAELRKNYYTIRVTKNLTPTVGNIGLEDSKSDAISSDNIGSKMLKLMGWSGGGLGKSSQGITEPVKVEQQMTREGLGLKAGMYNMGLFKKKCQEVIQNYIRGDTTTDLVFSPNFTSDERAMIHQIAQQMGLKSQSYGPKNKRILTISRKIHPRVLVKELLELGGSTEKYQLIEPTGN